MSCSTHSTPTGSHFEYDPVYGIAYNHAYTVVGVKQLSTGDKLVQVRNPWGIESYKGPWSDKDSRWTQALRDEVGRKSGDDGVWHIPIADFMKVMESAYVNKNTTGWSHGYFMKLNDTTTPNGIDQDCGSTCTRHELTISSDTATNVWVTANLWDTRGIPKNCNTDSQVFSVLCVNNQCEAWDHGSFTLGESFKVEPGKPLSVSVELDFTK